MIPRSSQMSPKFSFCIWANWSTRRIGPIFRWSMWILLILLFCTPPNGGSSPLKFRSISNCCWRPTNSLWFLAITSFGIMSVWWRHCIGESYWYCPSIWCPTIKLRSFIWGLDFGSKDQIFLHLATRYFSKLRSHYFIALIDGIGVFECFKDRFRWLYLLT